MTKTQFWSAEFQYNGFFRFWVTRVYDRTKTHVKIWNPDTKDYERWQIAEFLNTFIRMPMDDDPEESEVCCE